MNEPLPSNPDLELAICQDESGSENIWQVYSDWLLSVGHPLGAIIALELNRFNEESLEEAETKLRRRIQETYPDWGKGFYCQSDELGRLSEVKTREEETALINEVDIAPLVSYFPNLRELDVNGAFGISSLENRTLKALTLATDSISPAWNNVLSAPELPELSAFTLFNHGTPLEGSICGSSGK